MGSHNKISNYVNIICQQIRWKKAHVRIEEEMTAHITDGRDYYMSQGMDEHTATEQSIADTGDAALLGANFDRIHRPKPQWGMLGAVAMFVALGILVSVFMFDDANIQRRFIFTGMGIAVMFGAYFADFTILGRYSKGIFFGVIALSLIVITSIILGISHINSGTTHFFRVSFPLVFPLMFAVCIFALKNKGIVGVGVSGLVYGLLCVITAGWPQSWHSFLSGPFHFGVIGIAILLVAIYKNWFNVNKIVGILAALIPFSMVAIIGLYAKGWHRITAIINPHLDPLGFGYQSVMTRLTLRYSSLLGHGAIPDQLPYPFSYAPVYMTSLENFLPDVSSNLILTAIIYRYGWIPFIAIIVVILAFAAIGFMRCFKQKSGLGFLVSFAIMTSFAFQVVTYVLLNLGIALAPISLPFVSPGNVAIVINMGLIGFMLSVFRTGDVVVDKRLPQDIKQITFPPTI